MTSFSLNGPQKWSQKVAKQVALANLAICMCTKEIYTKTVQIIIHMKSCKIMLSFGKVIVFNRVVAIFGKI